MDNQRLIITNHLHQQLTEEINLIQPDKIYILSDINTQNLCFPRIAEHPLLKEANIHTIPFGDKNKNIQSVMSIWTSLSSLGASRRSLLINLGGGMISDLGGFAASTFKRGMKCINIPTTLLSMIDASLGGKTGINFNGLKNEIGAFYNADAVLVDLNFLSTLDLENKLSGYAEMLKHALISTETSFEKLLKFNLKNNTDLEELTSLVEESIAVKRDIVQKDPHEKGLRKVLNVGHTIGHAFESYALQDNRPILHGYAIAWGLTCELYIAHKQCGFPQEDLKQLIEFIKNNYGVFSFTCKEYNSLYEFMLHDKKNTLGEGVISMPLLVKRGKASLNEIVQKELILESLDFYRDFMGI